MKLSSKDETSKTRNKGEGRNSKNEISKPRNKGEGRNSKNEISKPRNKGEIRRTKDETNARLTPAFDQLQKVQTPVLRYTEDPDQPAETSGSLVHLRTGVRITTPLSRLLGTFLSSFRPWNFVLRSCFEASRFGSSNFPLLASFRPSNFDLRSRFRPSNLRAVVLLLCAALLGGCGYHTTGVDNASLYRQDIQTVAVPVFVNRTYRRGLENELTQSIIQQLEEHSPYKVVPKERADTILEGEILAATVTLQDSNGTTGLPQDQQFTIAVNFTWKNLRTGDILCQRKNFDQRADFMPTLGESSTVASTNAIQQLGLAIVQELEADW